jgi:hypothetical protein
MIDMPLQDPSSYLSKVIDFHKGLLDDEVLLGYLEKEIQDTRALKNGKMKLSLSA